MYREHDPSLSLSCEVRELLVWARRRMLTAIATAGYPLSQRAKVAATGLEELVDVVMYANDLPYEHVKPDVRWFLKAADLLRVRPDDCVHVGDNPNKDFIAAKDVGMTTVRVRAAGGIYSHIEGPAVDYEISHVPQLREVLGHNAPLFAPIGKASLFGRTGRS
jgi:putative hydrolase of the HAD superfamily